MISCTCTVRFSEKQAADLEYMAELQGLKVDTFVRQQLGLEGIENLPRAILADVSQGCVRDRGLATCDRCGRVRFLGRGGGTCFDCSSRAAEACSDEVHAIYRSLNLVGSRCAFCGAAAPASETGGLPVCVPMRDASRSAVDASNGYESESLDDLEFHDQEAVGDRGSIKRQPRRPVDCGEETDYFLGSDYYVTLRFSQEEAVALETMSEFQGMTVEMFLRRQLGLFRFNRLPDWMLADASQGCVLCASWRECSKCGGRGLIGRGSDECIVCVPGPYTCGYEAHSAFWQLSSKPHDSGDVRRRRCELCRAVFVMPDEEPSCADDASGDGTESQRTPEVEILEVALDLSAVLDVERVRRDLFHSADWMTAARVECPRGGSDGRGIRGERGHLAALADALGRAADAAEADGSRLRDLPKDPRLFAWSLRDSASRIEEAIKASDGA